MDGTVAQARFGATLAGMRTVVPLVALASLALAGCGGSMGLATPVVDAGAEGGAGEPAHEIAPSECAVDVRHAYGRDDAISRTGRHVFRPDGALRLYSERTANGTEIVRVERSFDASGRRIEQRARFDSLGPKHRFASWHYDDEGRVIRIVSEARDTDDAPPRRTTVWRRYDGAGRIVESRSSSGTATSYAYDRDGERGVLVTLTTDSDPAATATTRYTLRDDDRIARVEHRGRGGTLRVETYRYDERAPSHLVEHVSDAVVGGGAEPRPSTIVVQWSGERVTGYHSTFWLGDERHEQRVAFRYDDAGRLVQRRWQIVAPRPEVYLTAIEWTDGQLARVVRSVERTGERIEEWRIERGCARDVPLDVLVAPVSSFRYELEALPVAVEVLPSIGRFPEVL